MEFPALFESQLQDCQSDCDLYPVVKYLIVVPSQILLLKLKRLNPALPYSGTILTLAVRISHLK